MFKLRLQAGERHACLKQHCQQGYLPSLYDGGRLLDLLDNVRELRLEIGINPAEKDL
jgi:hypothetical protein